MTDKQLVRFVTDFRTGVLAGKSSDLMCFAVCAALVPLLRRLGIRCELVKTDLEDSDLPTYEHFWIQLADGCALDPTADQFNGDGADSMPSVYLGPPLSMHGVLSAQLAPMLLAG